MNYLFFVDHGSGLEFMQCSIIRDFAKEHKDDKIYITAINSYFADVIASVEPNVESINRNTIQTLFLSIMNDKDNWIIKQPEVYKTSKFMLRNDNFYDCYRELIGMKRKKDYSTKGSNYMPEALVPEAFKKAAEEFSKQHPKFIIFQRAGGINPVSPKEERIRASNSKEMGLLRSYDLGKSEKLVEMLVNDGYEVLQYSLPEEPKVKGCIYLQEEQNQLFYAELAKYADGIITIDSSLMHLTINNCKKMVVIWGQSCSGDNNVIGFGYSKAINLTPKNYKPVAPYFAGLPDTPIVEFATPEEVYNAYKNSSAV